MTQTETQTRTRSGTTLSDLDWPLIVALGALGLVRPVLGVLGYAAGRPWLGISFTLLVTAVWIGGVLLRRARNPVATLVAVGGTYALLTIAFIVVMRGTVLLSLATVGGIIAIDLVWGGIAGLVAEGIRRVRA